MRKMENGTLTNVDGEGTIAKVTADNGWKYSFNNLNKYDKITGEKINYTITETAIDGYTPTVSTDENGDINISNRRDVDHIKPEKVITGVKVKDGQTFVEVNPDEFAVSVGDTVKYEITVTNDGNTDLDNIVIKDNKEVTLINVTVPEEMNKSNIQVNKAYAANANLVEGLTGKLKPGKSVKAEVTYEVKNNADIQNKEKLVNTATASATNVPDQPTDEEINIAHTPSVKIEKTSTKVNGTQINLQDRKTIGEKENVADVNVKKGDIITYEITVTNTGDVTLQNVKVTDDKNVTYGASDSDITGAGITLEPGATRTIEVTYTVTINDINDSSNTITNVATVTAKYDNEDVTPNSDDDDVTEAEVKPSITVTKKNDKPNKTLKYGETLTYTIEATNSSAKDGKVTITDAKLKEAIDLGYVSAPSTITVNDGTTLTGNRPRTITVDQLAKGVDVDVAGEKKATITFTVTVTAKANTEIVNFATITGGENDKTEENKNKVEKAVNYEEYSQSIKAKNIVLVLDLSSSMNDKVNGGGTRLDAAKAAIREFVEKVYKDGNGKDVEIRLVTFNWESYEEYSENVSIWDGRQPRSLVIGTNLYTTINSSDYVSKLNAIDGIAVPNNMTTDITAGINKAKSELANFTNKNNDNVVIFLGDGEPDSKNGIDNVTSANNAATQLKSSATLYTIGFGLGTNNTAKTLMENMASPDGKGGKLAYTAENRAELINSFDAITKSVSDKPTDTGTTNPSVNGKITINLDKELAAGKQITITVDGTSTSYDYDKLPSGLTYNSSTKTIEWDISNYNANANLKISYII